MKATAGVKVFASAQAKPASAKAAAAAPKKCATHRGLTQLPAAGPRRARPRAAVAWRAAAGRRRAACAGMRADARPRH
jgi:hypothetical protein